MQRELAAFEAEREAIVPTTHRATRVESVQGGAHA